MRTVKKYIILINWLLAKTHRAFCSELLGSGVGNLQRFIYDGNVIDFGRFPWFGTLFVEMKGGYGTYICGSVLYSENVVLTAAHCVENAEFVTVSFNDVYNPDQVWYPHPNRYAKYAHIHPDYDTETLKFDIAVIELNRDVDDIQIPTVELEANKWIDIPEDYMLTVIGHGLTEKGTLD